MKIALINPKSESTRVNGFLKQLVSMYRVTFPTLAAYLPEYIDLTVYEENVEKIDFNEDFELVGISVLTSAFNRAKEISELFRDRGTPVVWGGIHPTVLPEESKLYADVVVRGGGELALRDVISDYEKGQLKREYVGSSIANRLLPNRSVLKGKSLLTFETIETSRGCPHDCAYCSVNLLYGTRYQQFSIDSVIADLESINGKYIFFVDDNLFGNPIYAKKLFERMTGLNKQWLSQAPVYAAEDDELLRLAAKSGCFGLYFGLESISQESLSEAHKQKNDPLKYTGLIKKVHDFGIGVEAGFIFGFDNDDKSIFDRTLEFIDKNQIDSPNFHILTPYPGTALFQRLEQKGRLLHEDWSKYNTGHVVFQPKQMSPEELQWGYDYAYAESHSLRRIINRTLGSSHPFYTFVVNLADKGKQKFK